MKLHFYSFAIVAALLLSLSCEKTPNGTDEQATVTLSATLENGRQWKQGDEVVINGNTYTVEVGGKSTVSIEGVVAADYYYGAYDFGSGAIEGTILTTTLPALQGPAISVIEPMVAANGTTNLVFKHLVGRLRLNIKGTGTITRAALSSVDSAIAGKGSIDMNFSGSPLLDISAEGERVINVDLGEGVTLPADIDIYLPAQSYSGLSVTLYGTNDEVMSAQSISALEVRRGEVTSASVTYEPDTVAPTYLTATIEADAEGKTHSWGNNAVIYVNGVPAAIAGGQGTANGEFGPVSTAESYIASTSSASANGVSGTTMRIAIPATQQHTAQLFNLNPAVAKSSDSNLSFTYLAGVVTVKATGPHILRRIVLAGMNNRRLAGQGVVDLSTATARLSLNADAVKEVVVDCGTAGVNIEAGATFRFVIPAEDYSEGFTVTMTDTNGQTFSHEIAGAVVARNAIADLGTIEWQSSQGDNNNLSKLGYANCYMVHLGGEYTFATRKVDNTPINDIEKVDWLWMTSQGLLSNISYSNGTVSFTASESKGNALLAAFDAQGKIVWSWHIWLTDKPEDIDYKNNVIPQSNGVTDGYYSMDRNLGATEATALGDYSTFGLYYQWGRKDPFIGDTTEERTRDTEAGGWKNITTPFGNSANLTVCNSAYAQAVWAATPTSLEIGSIEYATANPMTFLTADPNKNKANWLNLDNLGSEKNNIIYDADKSLWRPFQKSNYDPCPVGYQVPRKAMWVALVSTNSVYTQCKGFVNTTEDGVSVWYPSAGYRSAHSSDAGALMSVQNTNGIVKLWTSELEVSETSYCFTFSDPVYNVGSGAAWGNGYNVRCVKAY